MISIENKNKEQFLKETIFKEEHVNKLEKLLNETLPFLEVELYYRENETVAPRILLSGIRSSNICVYVENEKFKIKFVAMNPSKELLISLNDTWETYKNAITMANEILRVFNYIRYGFDIEEMSEKDIDIINML